MSKRKRKDETLATAAVVATMITKQTPMTIAPCLKLILEFACDTVYDLIKLKLVNKKCYQFTQLQDVQNNIYACITYKNKKSVLHTISKMKALKSLEFTNSCSLVDLKQLIRLKYLQSLKISFLKIESEPKDVKQFSKVLSQFSSSLQFLEIGGPICVTNEHIHCLSHLTCLKSLDISRCWRVTNKVYVSLAQLTQLNTLVFPRTIRSKSLAEIAHLPLTELDVGQVRSNITDEDLQPIQMAKVRFFVAVGPFITEKTFLRLSRCLKVLCMDPSCFQSEQAKNHFTTLKNLRYLNLCVNDSVTSHFCFEAVKGCKKLRTLAIRATFLHSLAETKLLQVKQLRIFSREQSFDWIDDYNNPILTRALHNVKNVQKLCIDDSIELKASHVKILVQEFHCLTYLEVQDVNDDLLQQLAYLKYLETLKILESKDLTCQGIKNYITFLQVNNNNNNNNNNHNDNNENKKNLLQKLDLSSCRSLPKVPSTLINLCKKTCINLILSPFNRLKKEKRTKRVLTRKKKTFS